MSLADAYQDASTQARGKMSVVMFDEAKHDLTMRAADRVLFQEALLQVDDTLSVKDFDSYLSLQEEKEHMGGNNVVSRFVTRSVGRDKSKDGLYEDAYAAYQEMGQAFSDYVESDVFGSDTEHEFYQLYQDMECRVEEYAGTTGHMGGKDHGLTPKLRSLERYQPVDEAVLSYLSEKRSQYGYSDSFKVDCTGFYIEGEQKDRVLSELGMTEEQFDVTVSGAKTMVAESNERFHSLFGKGVDKSAGQFASAVAAFGDRIAGAAFESVSEAGSELSH